MKLPLLVSKNFKAKSLSCFSYFSGFLQSLQFCPGTSLISSQLFNTLISFKNTLSSTFDYFHQEDWLNVRKAVEFKKKKRNKNENQWNKKLVLWKMNKIDKPLAKLRKKPITGKERKRERGYINYQHQEWRSGHHYWSHGLQGYWRNTMNELYPTNLIT